MDLPDGLERGDKVLVSACLMGEEVLWKGGHDLNPQLLEALEGLEPLRFVFVVTRFLKSSTCCSGLVVYLLLMSRGASHALSLIHI